MPYYFACVLCSLSLSKAKSPCFDSKGNPKSTQDLAQVANLASASPTCSVPTITFLSASGEILILVMCWFSCTKVWISFSCFCLDCQHSPIPHNHSSTLSMTFCFCMCVQPGDMGTGHSQMLLCSGELEANQSGASLSILKQFLLLGLQKQFNLTISLSVPIEY